MGLRDHGVQKLLKELKNSLVVVAGGGYFGTKAVRLAKEMGGRVLVVDSRIDCEASKFVDEIVEGWDPRRILTVRAGSATLFVFDAVEFLSSLMKTTLPDYIAPAVPGHLAGKLVKNWLERDGLVVECGSKAMKDVVGSIPKGLIVYQDEGIGIVITSYMQEGGRCKVPCDQPLDRCNTTGRPKMGPMYRILTNAILDKVTLSKVLFSHNLKGEVGFFMGSELMSFLSEVKRLKAPYSLAIGTACGCHGILNLFSISNPS
jgi:hypothetical protein